MKQHLGRLPQPCGFFCEFHPFILRPAPGSNPDDTIHAFFIAFKLYLFLTLALRCVKDEISKQTNENTVNTAQNCFQCIQCYKHFKSKSRFPQIKNSLKICSNAWTLTENVNHCYFSSKNVPLSWKLLSKYLIIFVSVKGEFPPKGFITLTTRREQVHGVHKVEFST